MVYVSFMDSEKANDMVNKDIQQKVLIIYDVGDGIEWRGGTGV